VSGFKKENCTKGHRAGEGLDGKYKDSFEERGTYTVCTKGTTGIVKMGKERKEKTSK